MAKSTRGKSEALLTTRGRQPKSGIQRKRSESILLTKHLVRHGDARSLPWIPSQSVHCVVTSPPYANLIEYPGTEGQLGSIASYEHFLTELDKVWAECFRVLVPGGRVVCVVGDVCISRREGGRHYVLPLSADIQVRTRRVGFDSLTPIRWLKVSNIRMEASNSSRFLGKPNLPNGIVKNDLEHILFFRKPGGYRKPTQEQERLSRIETEEYSHLFSAIWSGVTGQLRSNHPAPFPVEIARRLIRMFSFAGDTVLDPFAGTGSTAVAAIETGRNSVCVEIEGEYVSIIEARLLKQHSLISNFELDVVRDEEANAKSSEGVTGGSRRRACPSPRHLLAF